ncbi:MAG: hypothetical protein ABFS35_11060 [Bacteroidota bacterium]
MKNIAFQGLTCFTVKLEVESCKKSKDLGVLLLESDHKPGYYSVHNFPPNKKKSSARHCYLLVKNSVNCFQDIVLRLAREVRQNIDRNIHITPGQMTFQNEEYQCVRINTRDLEYVPGLISNLKSIGIEFVSNRKVGKYNSLIYFKKYIEFIELMDGVYQDANLPGRYFFSIPKTLDYAEFESKIGMIKNSCEFHLFDAFLNHFFWKDHVQDFVGIYSEHCDENRFDELKEELKERFS